MFNWFCDMILLYHNFTDNAFKLFTIDGENWTETKVLRRFIWHDRIHAKALYRHGLKMGMGPEEIANPFYFSHSPYERINPNEV